MRRYGLLGAGVLMLAAMSPPGLAADGGPSPVPGPPLPPGLAGAAPAPVPGPIPHSSVPPPRPLPGIGPPGLNPPGFAAPPPPVRPPVQPYGPPPLAGSALPYDPAYGRGALMSEELQVMRLQQQLGNDSPDLRQLRLDLSNARRRLDQYRTSQTPEDARLRRQLLDDSLRRLEMRRLRVQQELTGSRPSSGQPSGKQ